MSSGQGSRQRKEPAPDTRAPLFEVRDRPLPRPPRPIETLLGDVGDLPDGGPRSARHIQADLSMAEPAPAITPPAPAGVRAPLSEPQRAPYPAARHAATEARPAYTRREYDRRLDDRQAWYEAPGPWSLAQANGRTLLLLVVALLCGAVIWMFLQSPKTFISPYSAPGWSEAAGNAISKVFGSVDVPAGEHSILGQPSITVDQVEAVLNQYNSPARGTGEIWIELGKQYGIDPAYPLAFFIQESTAGTNPGWAGLKPGGGSTHNVGNIICAGYATCYKGNRDYPSWEAGIDDWYRLIAREYVEGRRLASIEQILPIYCPISDGCHSSNYISIVNSMVDTWRQGQLFQ
jgi:Mannosyl-glycoprotein endo-beta-N-acetylglucosaminidase